MIFSYCCATNADSAKTMYDLGYTGTESTISCINDLDDAAFEAFLAKTKEYKLNIRRVNLPNVKLLVDYYHAILGGDTLEELASYGDNIVHVHIASPKNNRAVPNENDYDDCVEFFRMLKKIGYKGVISVEARTKDDVADGKAGLAVMTKAMAEA